MTGAADREAADRKFLQRIHTKAPVPESLFNRKKHLIRKKLRHRCFHVNIAKFSRTAFLRKLSGDCFHDEQTIFFRSW